MAIDHHYFSIAIISVLGSTCGQPGESDRTRMKSSESELTLKLYKI